jgi:predicted nucleic acid-binding protein
LKVVCDTSPPILLAKIGRLVLLSQLYEQVIIPVSVLDEIEAKPGQETIDIKSWIENQTFEIQQVSREALHALPAELGSGEREAIALAVETEADLVVLDDMQGRRVARERDLPVTGTIGILIEARERGLIPSLRPELDRLIEAGMWIDEIFYHRLLQEFDE